METFIKINKNKNKIIKIKFKLNRRELSTWKWNLKSEKKPSLDKLEWNVDDRESK